jgi:hypothetical protein
MNRQKVLNILTIVNLVILDFLVIAVLIVGTMAKMQASQEPLPVDPPVPALAEPPVSVPTPVPTQVAPTLTPIPVVDRDDVLLSNGFTREAQYDSQLPGCRVYFNLTDGLVAGVCKNGSFVIDNVVGDYDAQIQGQIVGKVILRIFGIETLEWVNNNFPTNINQDKQGIVNGNVIHIQSKADGTVIIGVIPQGVSAGGPNS